MMSYIPIIGRDTELRQIDDYIHAHSIHDIICIVGSGGIGKTRLLQEVRERYLLEFGSPSEKDYWISEIISFDDPSLHIANNVRRLLIKSLGEKYFKGYVQALADWHKMKDSGIGRERLALEESFVENSFVQDFNFLASESRTILFFDTIDEEMEKTESWNYLIQLLPSLNNVVILAAGRAADKFYEELGKTPGNRTTLIRLSPLGEDASIEYFQRKMKRLHISVDPLISNRIVKLSKGRPILIDLAVEWLAREIPLPWLEVEIAESDLANFEAELEKKLIAPVGELRTMIDRLILVASYVYPVSEKFIAFLFSIEIDKVQDIFKHALDDYIYFKPLVHNQITLHDEVRRMVNKWVWEDVDPNYERRKEYSARFVEYATLEVEIMRKKIKTMKSSIDFDRSEKIHYHNEANNFSKTYEEIDQEDLWALETLRLDHILRFDPQRGFATFEELYNNTTAEYLFSIRRELLYMMNKQERLLSSVERVKLDFYSAESVYESGQTDIAFNILIKYVSRKDIDSILKIPILLTLGNCLVRMGRIDEADKVFTEAFQLSLSIEVLTLRGKSQLTLGWFKRIQGRWEQANKLFLSALDISFQANDLVNAAMLLNSIGYVHCLRGDYDGGRRSCLQALEIFERLSRPREKAMVLSTLGENYTGAEQFGEAMKHYSQALEIFEAADDWEWICVVKHEIARSLWLQNKFEDAWKSVQESLVVAENHKIGQEIPTILFFMGWIKWDRTKFQTLGELEYEISTEYFLQSYEESLKYQDKFRQLSNLVALAEICYIFGKYENVPAYAKELATEISSNNLDFPLLEGQMERIQGNIDYERARLTKTPRHYSNALKHFAKSIPLIAKHGGTGRYSLVNELLFLGDRIDDLEAENAITWCQTMRKKWSKDRNIVSNHPELLNFCDVRMALAKTRSV